MHHKVRTCASMMSVVRIWKSEIERQVKSTPRIHLPRPYKIEAFRTLEVSLGKLWPQVPGKRTDRVGTEALKLSGTLQPYLEFGGLFE